MRTLAVLLIAAMFGASFLATTPASADTFSSALWQLSLKPDGSSVTPTSQFAIQFLSDGKVAIQAGCDPAAGTWRRDGSSLAITITLNVGCSDGQQFLAYLAGTASYGIAGDTLTLVGKDSRKMVFRAAPI